MIRKYKVNVKAYAFGHAWQPPLKGFRILRWLCELTLTHKSRNLKKNGFADAFDSC